MKKLIKILSIITLTFSFIGFYAKTAQGAELNFAVEPVIPDNQIDKTKTYFDLKMTPGKNQLVEINLRNDTEKEVIVEPKVTSATTNLNGVVEYGPTKEKQDSTLNYQLSDLVEVDKSIKIPAKSSVVLPLAVTMPEEEFDGILAGGITLQEKQETKENAASDDKGLSIQNNYAYVVAMVLSVNDKAVDPLLKLNKVEAGQVNARNVINATIQNTTPVYVNQLSVQSKITYKGNTKTLYRSSKEAMQMAPNSHFAYPISLEGKKLEAGEYTLEMTAKSKDNVWKWKKEFTISAEVAKELNTKDVQIKDPSYWLYILIGVILLAIALLIFILYRRRKKQKEEAERRKKMAQKRKKRQAMETRKRKNKNE
ncbi:MULTISPECIES: DUF916 and DUF3324 domain-containing protein [Carnobacterium]|uniref:DUF916 and DUF3324 domain-containing protein n=1 Tax=Carnobacterium TaxID=2747 RepID=UPI0028919C44|nr:MULTISPECIES: DUF916 and DUF3324 domain-containing protein [Carnobacterium]MDT1940328.1 DUF3324 domain-containing protein [Carnobacterium divergens]MDT1942766.1 DUF3324 domain-containing protein [Carnobacterium divergens]MDT1948572.1 DUF3324 domain-containing protein [Carnobacterium divergens]MDT1951053.1 DUF3324 domain-containing protein [Carnobacterium divergens]MDT1956111.1 DUF3324 domain-containing protein [Carnobacterium divergens]